jgi:hypothetical protein
MSSGEVSAQGSKGVPGWLQTVGFVVTLCITIYTGIFAAKEKNRADLLAQQIANEKEVPKIEQGRFVFAGDALKSILSNKKNIVIEGLPNPEFVATTLGQQIIQEIKRKTSLKELQSISVEFISFTNKGPRLAKDLIVKAPGQRNLELGSVAVNTTKLLPVFYLAEQPFRQLPADPPKSPPSSYSTTYELLGQEHELTGPIAPRATVSWIPVVGNAQGVGRALNDQDMEQHLTSPN